MRFSLALAAALSVSFSCASTQEAQRYKKTQTAANLERLEKVSLEVGEFDIDGASSVVDGDTIKVHGLDASLRLLAIDTEETFKHDSERRAYAAGWEHYIKAVRGDSPRPVKFATPMGEAAKAFAQHFFEGVDKVKLERDHPGEIRDYYGRYLAYVFAQKDGQWVNYNLEAVKAGMSPYFTKYGRSRRFHKEFLEAQKNAREAKLGIWNASTEHYPDYDERLAWWNGRAEAIWRFEKQMEEHPNDYVVLTRWDALLKLGQKVGEQVTLLGAVSDIKLSDSGGPSLVKLSKSKGRDFDVVFWDKDVLLSSGVMQNKGEYVQIRGTVQKWHDKLEIVVSLPGQVLAPSKEIDKLLEAEQAPNAEGE